MKVILEKSSSSAPAAIWVKDDNGKWWSFYPGRGPVPVSENSNFNPVTHPLPTLDEVLYNDEG